MNLLNMNKQQHGEREVKIDKPNETKKSQQCATNESASAGNPFFNALLPSDAPTNGQTKAVAGKWKAMNCS